MGDFWNYKNGQLPPSAGIKMPEPSPAMLLPDEQLEDEMKRRQMGAFPSDVFPIELMPWLNHLLVSFKVEPSWVGLSLLAATSTAIGSGLRGAVGSFQEKLAIYGVLVGMTSSGKSVSVDHMFMPIREIQKELDQENREAENTKLDDGSINYKKLAIVTEDTTFGSFVELLFQNPKGVSKVYDELSTFFDDMERFKTVNAGEDKFWLKVWNSKAEHRISRKGKPDMIIPEETLFCNIFGGTQPAFLKHFYIKTRYESGFSSRFLFAIQDKYEILDIDPEIEFPREAYNTYASMIHELYRAYKPLNHGAQFKVARFTKESTAIYKVWQDGHIKKLRGIKNETEKDARAGIYGKMKQYVIRFATLLQAMEQAVPYCFSAEFDKINARHVRNACRLADYFMESGYDAFERVNKSTIIPPEVMEFLATLKANNFNFTKTADIYKCSRTKIRRLVAQYHKDYPTYFK